MATILNNREFCGQLYVRILLDSRVTLSPLCREKINFCN